MSSMKWAVLALLSIALPAPAQTHLVIVSGLSGEASYADEFHEWATVLIDAASDRWGLQDSHLVYLSEHTELDPDRITARSTRENIEQALRDLSERSEPDDLIFIVLVGHGSVRGDEARFNLPGPDMNAADFAAALEAFTTQKIVFVNAASASGDFIMALSGDNRTIITATKNSGERNRTLFGRYFVEAYADDGADVDKDERVSALEAFTYARREVARAYESEGLLLTEHALLDDNGDGEGSAEPEAGGGEGSLARNLFLSGEATFAGGRQALTNPQLAELYRQREELERQVEALKGRKDAMDTETYERELEELLTELALKARAIRALEEEER